MTTSLNPRWILRKAAVLVDTPEFNVSCITRLRISHNNTVNQGSISLRITADLANQSGRSRVLTLNISPEIIEDCVLAPISNDDIFPPRLISMLPAPVRNVSAVSTLSLSLRATGIVLCPSDIDSLSPANQEDVNFHAFSKICQSKVLRIHFSRRQFVNNELALLKAFSSALQGKTLQAEFFDFARLATGQGVVQKDWRVFSQSLDPPPYSEKPVSEQVVGKRRRDSLSIPPDDERRKRHLLPPFQPLGSPTEVNTPSTSSPSPSSIRLTSSLHAFSPSLKERNRLFSLAQELHGVPDDLICELLVRSGHQHLLAKPEAVNNEVPSEPEKDSFDKVECRLKQYVDEMIERRLKPHVVDEIVDNAIIECREQISDEHKTNEAEFREQLEEGNYELRNTANGYMKEIEEQAQRYIDDIEDQGIKFEVSANEELTKLKSWFTTFAQSLFDSKTSLSLEQGTNARRSSA